MSSSTVHNPQQSETLLIAKEVAKRLRVSLPYVRLATRQGKIPCVKFGRSVRYSPEQVDLLRRQGV